MHSFLSFIEDAMGTFGETFLHCRPELMQFQRQINGLTAAACLLATGVDKEI